jgi:hypothetical protein
MRQCRRVLSASGVASHQVDLRDHLSEGLNNLRFNEEIWESDFFVKSGFYTNRIRFTEMMSYFIDSGFTANAFNTIRWNKLPIDREALDVIFSDFEDEDLNIQVFDVILRPSNF